MAIKEMIKDMLDTCNKYNLESVPIMKNELEQVLKDLEEKEKQDKILSILKNKKVDIKLVLWAGQKVEAYNVVVRETKHFPREELTQEEFDDIKEWLGNENKRRNQ
jgi:L-lactate utilization protein LutC